MQSEPTPPDAIDSTADVKHAPLWGVAFLILAIVFGPALIAGIFSLLR